MIVHHLLDNFFIIGPTKAECQDTLLQFLCLCNQLGIPISAKKTTEGPAQSLTFLGIDPDTVQKCAPTAGKN